MATTQERNTPQLAGDYYALPVKAGSKIYAGTLVAIDADGFAIPATKAEGLSAAGRAEETVENTGGAVIVVARGVFRWDNDPTDPLTQADVGRDCYLLDDQTVTGDATGASVAGRVLAVAADGVIVETR